MPGSQQDSSWLIPAAPLNMLRLWREKGGSDLAEYALLLVLISVTSGSVLLALNQTLSNVFDQATQALPHHPSHPGHPPHPPHPPHPH